MSTIQHNQDWLGTHSDWGLTRTKHTELCDELSDHLSEMARMESHGNAQEAKDALSQPKVRRKLAGVHLTDQVYATLNRLPNKQEWRELAWLGLWYVLIVVSDIVSVKAAVLAGNMDCDHGWVFASFSADSPVYTTWVTLAWLLQGVARGGFYACFFASLWRAWKLGAGVCLARVLQLKLIHTLLVIGAFLAIGNQLWSSWFTPIIIQTGAPLWLSAPLVLAVSLTAGVMVFTVSRRKLWVPALGLVLAAFFLYPAAPAVVETYQESEPLAVDWKTLSNGKDYLYPSKNPEKIANAAAGFRKGHGTDPVDQENNRFYSEHSRVVAVAGTYWELKPHLWLSGREYYLNFNSMDHEVSPDYYTQELTGTYLAAPISAPGASLGWIAAPIPLLGVIGLFGLLFLMGRRSAVAAVMYSGLVFLSIASTIFPFLVASNELPLFDFTPLGIVSSPCPGFEGLICNLNWNGDWLLIFGLVLSAAIPWLLTGLFLKPGLSVQQADDGDGTALAE